MKPRSLVSVVRVSAVLSLVVLALGGSALAQNELRSRLHPITAPIRNAGVFHVATGTWTRNGSLANLTGPDTIYNNSCSPIYFVAQVDGEKWQHRARVPSPTGPLSIDACGGGWQEAPGCATSYLVNGFEVAYCSSKPSGGGTITYAHQFASSYTACGSSDLVPQVTITLTGLPGGTSTGAQICWIVQVDLDASSESFVLTADGDGTYVGPSNQETFGWSCGPTSGVSASDLTGPILAGNHTWMGGPGTGPLTPCTGTDGTIWDEVVNLAEPGTGMASESIFRITGTTTAPNGPGCYFFNGPPHADFYLKLFSNAGCAITDPLIDFCFPGQGGIISCPCNNPPTSSGRGCNNFGAGPAFSAEIDALGTPSVTNDSAVLYATGENQTSTTIFLQSPSSSSTGLIFGAGVRCLTGTLRRLYSGPAACGAISRPGPADPKIHVRSAALGDPLSPGSNRYYMTYYRDPQASGPCSNAASTFNCSNTSRMTWLP